MLPSLAVAWRSVVDREDDGGADAGADAIVCTSNDGVEHDSLEVASQDNSFPGKPVPRDGLPC